MGTGDDIFVITVTRFPAVNFASYLSTLYFAKFVLIKNITDL